MSKFAKAALSISRFYGQQSVSIPSQSVKMPSEKKTWSKRDMQRMKGKATRKNRGKNRKKMGEII